MEITSVDIFIGLTVHVHTYLRLSLVYQTFPSGSEINASACNAGDLSLIPGSGRSPGGGHGNPFQYSYLENPPGQKSLVGYSPWGYSVGHD